jgi:cell division GTPase FtsZ
MEVNEVMTEIHSHINPQAEIVLGATHDEQMLDRAQVILVITGLGAPSLETVMPGITFQKPKPTYPQEIPTKVTESIPSLVAQPVESVPISTARSVSTDLDLPAFLRRRARLTN